MRSSKSDEVENPTAPTREPVTTEQRSLDIGESGQFAPGGYDNQQGINELKRVDLDDDDVLPPTCSSHGN